MTSAPARARRIDGRLVSAGFVVPAGTCSQLPAWWGREHWLNVDVWCAVAANRLVCKDEHVDPDTVVRVARAHAAYADNVTGRDCRPTNERLSVDLGMSVRQVQRARRVLLRLKLMAETVRGRSIMTRLERLRAWRRGLSHRRIAAEFALLSLRVRPQPPDDPVERVTPPAHRQVGWVSHQRRGFFESKDRRMSDAPRRTHSRRPPGRVTVRQARAQRLIAGVQQRVGWLSGTSPRRLTSLHRFAAQGWTPRDVHRALDEVLRARGWSVPDRVEHPAAYLAALLRGVDPADRPGALEEAMLEEERRRREWIWQTTIGGRECEHGQLGGDLPHPIDGHLACPLCRRSALRCGP